VRRAARTLSDFEKGVEGEGIVQFYYFFCEWESILFSFSGSLSVESPRFVLWCHNNKIPIIHHHYDARKLFKKFKQNLKARKNEAVTCPEWREMSETYPIFSESDPFDFRINLSSLDENKRITQNYNNKIPIIQQTV
jgi:hypothetical protein